MLTMKKLPWLIICLLILCLELTVAFTEVKGERNMKGPDLFPKQIEGWSALEKEQKYTRDTIFNYMNGAGEMYLAYNFEELFVREFSKPSASPIIAEIFKMSSSEDAYGVFTNDRDGNVIDLGQGAIYAQGLLRVWKGQFFIRIIGQRETDETKAMIMKLGQEILASIPNNGFMPDLLDLLPSEGLIDDRIHYFHTQITLNFLYFIDNTNLLDLDSDTDVILARYRRNGTKVRLLFVKYPAAALAKTAFDQFNQKYLQKKSVSTNLVQIEKVENDEYVCASLSDQYLILVFEAKDQSTCKWLSEAVTSQIKETTK